MAKEIRSINALASLMGRSDTAVGKWVKREDWKFGPPPWPASKLNAIKEWQVHSLQEDRREESPAVTEQTNSLTRAKTALMTAKAMREQIALKREKEEVHDIAECQRAEVERIHFTKMVLISQVPSAAVREIRERERSLGRPLADLEMAEVIRCQVEDTIDQNLARAS